MRRYFLLILLLLTAACASATPELAVRKSGSQEVLVTGRVDLYSPDKTETPWFYLFVVPRAGGKAWEHRVTADHPAFFWYLPPGDYEIPSFQYRFGTGGGGGQLFCRFTVPAGKPAVYIGTLTITFAKGSRYKSQVFDDYEAGLKKLQEKFPEMKKEDLAKSIMVLGGR